MKINGNSDGGGGSLTPQQEALINQVPNKVDQVRLVTDGSVIRHEGALQALTFNQIYELVMDNSKYVYIVMDNNIRFRPSAYDGDAIWFDSSFIEEGKPNILRCIINSSNVVSIDQIVVASEDYVKDYVDEHGGGLTPEQQEALEPMFNTKVGVLKTTEYKAHDYVNRFKENLLDVNCRSSNENTTPGEFWFCGSGAKLYNFNPKTLVVEEYTFNDNFYNFFWKDNSGRLYCGHDFINFETKRIERGKVTYGTLTYYDYIPSIFHVGDEILDIWGPTINIFNEETQEFEQCEVDTEVGYPYPSNITYYEGSLVSINYNLKLVKEDDNYYRWENWTPEFSTTVDGYRVENFKVHYVDGVGYFFYATYNNVYKLEGTEWVKFNVYNPSGNWESHGSFSSVGNFLVGKRSGSFSILACADTKATSWGNLDSEYVKLTGGQNIRGHKSFESGSFNGLNVEFLYPNNINTTDLKINSDGGIEITSTKDVFINGSPASTKDDLFFNSEAKVGDGFVKVADGFSYSDQFGKLGGDIFIIWSGTTARKWNGLDWEFIELPFDFNQPIYKCKETTSHSVYIDDNQRTWEYADGQFTLINDEISPAPADFIYPLGDKLVVGGGYDYFDFNTNSWVEGSDLFASYNSHYVKVIGGITYYNTNYDLYKIEGDGTEISLGTHEYMDYPQSYFEYDGDIYFVTDGVYKFVKETNEFIKTDFYFKSAGDTYFEYNGKLYLSSPQEGGTGLVQVTEFVKPEVPAGDGNYVLRATRVGDKITYSWVSE